MLTLPNITLPNVQLPGTDVPRRRPSPPIRPAPSRTPRAKLKREMAAVQKSVELAARTFYEVGVQLNIWKTTQSWRALSSGTGEDFKWFVRTHVMAYSTASKLMTIADEYPKTPPASRRSLAWT